MTKFITKDNLDPNAFEFDSVNKVIRSKLGLINYSDTPSSYTGAKGKALVVNQAENGVEFAQPIWTIEHKDDDFTASPFKIYFVDTRAKAVTATIYGSIQAGDQFHFVDEYTNFATNNLTIARNGAKIRGLSEDLVIRTNDQFVKLAYRESIRGLLIVG